MTLFELQDKMPGFVSPDEAYLTGRIESYLDEKGIPYKIPLFGAPTIDDTNAQKVITMYLAEHQKELEAERLSQEEQRLVQEEARLEEARKKRATAQMLVTSGFNFDGYRIVKYSGYISGDDAMSVDRGYAWADISVRDKLMASLTQIRRNALRELKEAAYDLGCNAVIGVDFDYITLDPQTASIGGGTVYQPYVFCVTANGNAVIIEKIED